LLDWISWDYIPFCSTDPGCEGDLLAIRQNADGIDVDVLVESFCNSDQ
jgi:hypothetical protein